MTDIHGPWTWEKNGNFQSHYHTTTRMMEDEGCGLHDMDGCPLPPSNNFHCSEADWNSNKFVNSIEKKTDQVIPDSNSDCCACKTYSDSEENHNKGFLRDNSTLSPNSPTSIFTASLHHKDISYDDLSKNIDANLAEIDMETFRSEDINSILALPAIYSGDFQSASHGEQCASVSGSLLNGLELDSSVSPRNSEDEISICKDEPLFSPLKEPPVPESTISVDSLDSSSIYDHDFVLTCQANKNNYTIVFEGSGTQFSDDSDYQEVCGSSEGESSLSGATQLNHRSTCYGGKSSSMVQSDLVFTTWSKLRRTQRGSKKRCETTTDFSTKSQSLPNLSHHSIFITDKHLAHWATWRGNNCLPLYDIQSCHSNGLQIAHSKEHAQSVSLLKLFMKHKIPVSNSLEISSSHSDSSSSIIIQPVNVLNSSLETSLSWSNHKSIQENAEGNNQVNRKNRAEIQTEYKNDNETNQTQLLVDNIKLSDWNSPQNVTEANNNTINSLYSMDNNNVSNHNNWKEETLIISDGEYDNSQYFEDSLVEVPVPQLKVFQTMPIKEEEETDISSGDETMKDSRNPFGSDNSSLDDGAIIQNNTVDCVTHGTRHEWSNNLERINNIFPTGKSNVLLANETSSFNEEEKLPIKKVGFSPENQSQSTQTKQYNTKECTPIDEVQFPQTTVTKTSSNQTDGDTLNNVCYSLSRDSSPTSSGYASSRHSSVERIRRTSQAFNSNANASNSTVGVSTKKSNVMLTTTRTCSTQIPVHVKDVAMQTSLNSASNSYVGFTLKDSDEHIVESDHILEASSKISSENSVASAEELQQKKKKSIYVCYPNYSLPDLSFLKGVIGKEPEAIYLTPTKYKLPQEVINREKLMRPKSYAGFEAFSEKHLTNIKDWESLNVLLPDDLKHLISQMHAKSSKPESTFQMDGSCKSKLQQTPPCSCSSSGEIPVFSPSSSSNSSENSCKKHIPRSILRKSSSVGHCEDKCHIYLPPRCSSASSVDIKVVHMKSKQQKVEDAINTSTHVYKISQHTLPGNELIINKTLIGNRQQPEISHNLQPQLSNATFVTGTKSFSPNSLLSENPQSHLERQQPSACFDPVHCHSAVARFDGHYHKRMATADTVVNEQSKVPFCHFRNQELLHKLNDKLVNLCPDCNSSKLHSTESIQNQLHTLPSNKDVSLIPAQNDNVEENIFHHDPSKGKKAVKFCEKNPMKKTDYSDACLYNDPEEEPCCSNCIQYEIKERNLHEDGVSYQCDDDLDSENPPQEFVVSPTQGSSPFSPPSDFYFMQNSSGGGSKLFQEALRKKTGLVENLQKATEIISEHFQMNGGKKNIPQMSNNADFLTGQKILACLCPAVHTILSDGLLPTVQGFFGPLPNTPWKVAEASVQQGESRKEVQDLLTHVNAEKLLTDSTYRFNAFIIGLLNLHCLDWWIGHLCTCQSLICHHYHPTALLSLLALPAATHLRQELKELVSPLSNLPFELDLTYETRTTTGDTWSLGNRVRKNADENIKHDITISTTGAVVKTGDRKRITDLTFRLPPYIDNKRETDVNFKGRNSSIIDLLIPAKAAMNIKESPGECQEQLWPGVTVNPFPNIKMSEEQTVHNIHKQPKGSKDHYNVNAKLTSHFKPLMLAATSHGISNGHQRNCVKNENESREKEIPELSLCSSTDSGCSSQAEHSRQASQATAKAALPAKMDSKEKDGQQFKKLRQKWEKMTLGMDKQSNSKGNSQKQIPTKASFANHSKTRKKPSESVKTNRSGSGSPSNRDANPINHTHREASHSPTGRKTYTQPSAPAVFENRLQTPDVIASSQVPYHSPEIAKKPKSQIPLLKTGKSSHPKSMIPVHRTGARARSANRDYHAPAV